MLSRGRMHPAVSLRRALPAPHQNLNQDRDAPASTTENPAASQVSTSHFDHLSNEMVEYVFSYAPLGNPHTVRALSLTARRWLLCVTPARNLLYAKWRASDLSGLAHAASCQTLLRILNDVVQQRQQVRKEALLFLMPRCLHLCIDNASIGNLLQAIASLESTQDQKELFGVFHQLIQRVDNVYLPQMPCLPQLVEYMQALEMTVDERVLDAKKNIEYWAARPKSSNRRRVPDRVDAGLMPIGIAQNPAAADRPRSGSLSRSPGTDRIRKARDKGRKAGQNENACRRLVDDYIARLRDRRGYKTSCANIRSELLHCLHAIGSVDVRLATIRHAVAEAPNLGACAALRLLSTLAMAAQSLPQDRTAVLANAFVQALDACGRRHGYLPRGAAANLALACACTPGLKDDHLPIARILQLIEPLQGDRTQRPALAKLLRAIGMLETRHAAPLLRLLVNKGHTDEDARDWLWTMLSPSIMEHIAPSQLTMAFSSILERVGHLERPTHRFLNRLLAGFFAAAKPCKGQIEPAVVHALLKFCLECKHTRNMIDLGQGETPMFWLRVTQLSLLTLAPRECTPLLNDLLERARKLPGHGTLIRTEVIQVLRTLGPRVELDQRAWCRRMVEDEYTTSNVFHHQFVQEGYPEKFLGEVCALLPRFPERKDAHDLALLMAQRFDSISFRIEASMLRSGLLHMMISHISWPLLASREERLATLHQLLRLLNDAALRSDEKALALTALARKLGDCPCDDSYPMVCGWLIRHVRNNIERRGEDMYEIEVFEDLRNILCKPTLKMEEAAGAAVWRKVDEQLRELEPNWRRACEGMSEARDWASGIG